MPHKTASYFLLAIMSIALPRAAAAQTGVPVGSRPDPVVIETLDGDAFDLAELIGSGPVLFEFWATWCAVCRGLEPEMQAAYDAYGDRVEFVAVAAAVAQTRDQVRRHIERRPVPGRLLWDTRGRFTRSFDAPGTGWVVILDADGVVVYSGTGPDQDLTGALAEALENRD